jgi:hypothetical protein
VRLSLPCEEANCPVHSGAKSDRGFVGGTVIRN